MMKSYVPYLLGLMDSMLKDVESWYPEGATEWRRTQARLCSLVNSRGLRYLTVDLVTAGKHFDQCLERGSFFPSMVAGFAIRPGEAIPRLFAGLFLRVFTKRGKLRVDADVTAIAFLRQLFFAAKKVRMTCNESATYKTVEDFYRIDQANRKPILNWMGDLLLDPLSPFPPIHIGDEDTGGQAGHHRRRVVDSEAAPRLPLGDLEAPAPALSGKWPGLLEVIQRVADLASVDLGELNPSEIHPRHGPGAVSDLIGESKYDFPYWPDKLEELFPVSSFGSYNEGGFLGRTRDVSEGKVHYLSHEPPSRLIAVPKTQAGPRLIASEPTSHQWIQQGVLSVLADRIQASFLGNCISLRDQRPSRDLALLASLSDDLRALARKSDRLAADSFRDQPRLPWGDGQATVDLKEASDRVSCWLVERIFRRNLSFLSAFHATRTRWIVNNIDKKSPKFHKLRKFTTMGSALTFPVQSIIYAIVCIGVDIYMRNSDVSPRGRSPLVDPARISSSRFRREVSISSKRTRVFGDDIVHPVDSLPLLVEVLTYLGLKVNPNKTFAASFFRESCGIDAYKGKEVTPCYVNEIPLETKPETLFSVLESSNNFFLRGYWNAAEYLRNSLPKWFEKAIPVKKVGSGATGLVSFVGGDARSKLIWNCQLHHYEYQSFVLKNRAKKRKISGSSALHQYFTESPDPTVKWESGVVPRALPQLRKRGFPNYLLH